MMEKPCAGSGGSGALSPADGSIPEKNSGGRGCMRKHWPDWAICARSKQGIVWVKRIGKFLSFNLSKKIAWDGGNVNCVVHLPQALWYNEITVQLAYARKKGADEGWDFT